MPHTYICITVTHVGEFGIESIDIKPCAITKTCINAKGHLARQQQQQGMPQNAVDTQQELRAKETELTLY